MRVLDGASHGRKLDRTASRDEAGLRWRYGTSQDEEEATDAALTKIAEAVVKQEVQEPPNSSATAEGTDAAEAIVK